MHTLIFLGRSLRVAACAEVCQQLRYALQCVRAHRGGKIYRPVDFNGEIGPDQVETGSTSSRTMWARERMLFDGADLDDVDHKKAAIFAL